MVNADTIVGSDGTHYYTRAFAARRLAMKPAQIDSLRKLGRTSAPDLLAQQHGPGRPCGYLLLAGDVEALRADLLERLGVAREIETLQSEVDEVRAAWEREVVPLRLRIADLEEQRNATLSAFDKRLQAAIVQAEGDREFLKGLRS